MLVHGVLLTWSFCLRHSHILSAAALQAASPPGSSKIIAVPSLFRFLVIIGILAGLVYGTMFALATLVEPTPRVMTVTIPASKFDKK
jgi:hypothetical protein